MSPLEADEQSDRRGGVEEGHTRPRCSAGMGLQAAATFHGTPLGDCPSAEDWGQPLFCCCLSGPLHPTPDPFACRPGWSSLSYIDPSSSLSPPLLFSLIKPILVSPLPHSFSTLQGTHTLLPLSDTYFPTLAFSFAQSLHLALHSLSSPCQGRHRNVAVPRVAVNGMRTWTSGICAASSGG